jgi:hypothetical protein
MHLVHAMAIARGEVDSLLKHITEQRIYDEANTCVATHEQTSHGTVPPLAKHLRYTLVFGRTNAARPDHTLARCLVKWDEIRIV